MEKYLSISQMAELHNISRQTLIYYDKIELFKPTHIDDNGYRLYSAYQIPILREICFLKSIGIKLERIKENNYKIIGDVADICLLDTTFYDGSNKVDFCQLQIPIEDD